MGRPWIGSLRRKISRRCCKTVSQVKKLKREEMIALGLSGSVISSLNQTGRPPIHPDVIHRLFIKSKMTCSYCHEIGKNITIHHIEEYAGSKDHFEENLIVLCLNCHGEAHTKRDLGKNLTSEALIAMKMIGRRKSPRPTLRPW